MLFDWGKVISVGEILNNLFLNEMNCNVLNNKELYVKLIKY